MSGLKRRREGRRVPVQKPEHNVQRCDGVGGKGSHTEDRLEEETGAQGEERRREGSREERRRGEREAERRGGEREEERRGAERERRGGEIDRERDRERKRERATERERKRERQDWDYPLRTAYSWGG